MTKALPPLQQLTVPSIKYLKSLKNVLPIITLYFQSSTICPVRHLTPPQKTQNTISSAMLSVRKRRNLESSKENGDDRKHEYISSISHSPKGKE